MNMQSSISRSFRMHPMHAIATVLAVTGLMACSASKKVAGEQITFTNATIQVNGEAFGDEAGWTASGPARGILALTVGDSATYLISERMFEASLPTAQVSGNRLEATYYDHSLIIESEGIIHPKGEADLWVRRDPKFHVHGNSASPAKFRNYWAESYAQYKERLVKINFEQMGTDPGVIKFKSDPTKRRLVLFREPQLIGGFMKLLERVEYPVEARRNGIKGTVLVRFIVEPDGIPTNLEVIQGIGGGCDEAALAAVSEAKFEPARQDGEPVRVQFTLPLIFR